MPQEFTKIEDILTYILNVYSEENPMRDDELGCMGVYEDLYQIAKAMDIRALFVRVIL